MLYRVFFLMIRPPPSSTLFRYTTLFRSHAEDDPRRGVLCPSHPLPPLGIRCAFKNIILKESVNRNDPRRRRLPCQDRKSTRLNSSHSQISYAVFCLTHNIPYTPHNTSIH